MIFILIGAIIIYFIIRIDKDRKEGADIEFYSERIRMQNENRQIEENERIEREIAKEVLRRLRIRMDIEVWEKETEGMEVYEKIRLHPMFTRVEIFNPTKFCRVIYDIKLSKYHNVDINELIEKKVDEMWGIKSVDKFE